MNTRQSADEIESAAARWIWRLDREGSDPKLQEELHAWLAGGSRRRGAFLRAQATWALLDNPAVAPAPRVRSHRNLMCALAAGLAAGVIAVAILIFGEPAAENYQTLVGEIRQVPLGDGSTAVINTQTALAFSMTSVQRVAKIEHGEAWFRVARDPSRPFVVEAGRVRVRAVGTAFSVRRRKHGADVLVTQGIVQTWVAGAEGHVVQVEADGKAFVTDNAAISEEVAKTEEIDRLLAWRVGKIDLAGERLGDAVAEFNRYNRKKLMIEDDELSQQRLYGVFRTDDPEGFAHAVRRSLGAEVSFPHPEEIRLGR